MRDANWVNVNSGNSIIIIIFIFIFFIFRVFFVKSLLTESAKLSAAALAISVLYLRRFCCLVESFFSRSVARILWNCFESLGRYFEILFLFISQLKD